MTGNFVGFTRDSDVVEFLNLNEIRAYSWLPIDASTVTVTTNSMPNTTLINSTRITIPNASQTILNDDFFTSSSGENIYWMMNLGSRKLVKVLLVFGK
jgi:hypothetical protein